MKHAFLCFARVQVLIGVAATFFGILPTQSQTFTNTGSMNTTRYWHSAVLLPSGKVLVAGGIDSANNFLSSSELFDPILGMWKTNSPMNYARASFSAVVLPNGKVLVAGGSNPVNGDLSSAEIYDPASQTWTITGSLNIARGNCAAVLLPSGKVLIAGGYNSTIGYLSGAEIFDPATGSWTPTGSMITGRSWHSATLLPNGKVLVVGGEIAGTTTTATAELYNPATGLWNATDVLNNARERHTATLLADGKCLVAAGWTTSGNILSSSELYDSTTGTWSLTGVMNAVRQLHTAALLPDGRVLVAGGVTSGYVNLSSAELYDPVERIWTATGPMVNARNRNTSTLLSNGQLLITGGANNSGVLSGAELFRTNSGLLASGINSGSDGHDGVFNPATNIVVDMHDHPDGIYQYASVYIPAGVTVTFVPNANNTPVYWLVQKSCVINGTIAINGKMPTGTPYPTTPSFTTGGLGGPGGWPGGNGYPNPTPGQGPGGGTVPCGGGSYGTSGIGTWGSGTGGPVYGNASLIPLLGGSGGAGGGWYGAGGGGGGGAILICASDTIQLNGLIDASGTLGFYSGGSSGGAVKIYSSTFAGSGKISTMWTPQPGNDGGGLGRVRIDAIHNYFSGQIVGVSSQGTPLADLNIVQTNRSPSKDEITSQLGALPTTSQLLVYDRNASVFVTSSGLLDTNRVTIVLTHGWNSSPNGWPNSMAALIDANIPALPNIVAWDWSQNAVEDYPGTAAAKTGGEGQWLGQNLLNALGPNYSHPIHFIGHSLGTLVNARAADYVHANGLSWTNTQMTLFDEAEAATDITNFWSAVETLIGWNGNPLEPKPYYYYPLPKKFRWADNYVAAFGLLHPEAANVILTNNFPMNAPNVSAWFAALTSFHGYPMPWYDETIKTDVSALGHRWSFERGGFTGAPATNSVYLQAGAQWNLEMKDWTYGTNLLNTRFQAYRRLLAHSTVAPISAAINGVGSGQLIVGALPAMDSFIFSLQTTPANVSPAPQFKAYPMGGQPAGADGSTNIPAYAWLPLVVPTNAVSMSFNYTITGDWQNDSLAAAFNGTNVLFLAGNQIPTNTVFNSGLISVSAFAGKTNELFIGIVGGTSTNAQLTIQNLSFVISPPPLLQGQFAGVGHVLTWPLSAADYLLQTSTNLADPGSWTTVSNIPAIFNLQNTLTNSAPSGIQFYRLKK